MAESRAAEQECPNQLPGGVFRDSEAMAMNRQRLEQLIFRERLGPSIGMDMDPMPSAHELVSELTNQLLHPPKVRMKCAWQNGDIQGEPTMTVSAGRS